MSLCRISLRYKKMSAREILEECLPNELLISIIGDTIGGTNRCNKGGDEREKEDNQG